MFGRTKCSAGCRAISHEEVYDQVGERGEELTNELTYGDTSDNSNFTGPVIDQASVDKVMSYIEIGKEEGKKEDELRRAQTAKIERAGGAAEQIYAIKLSEVKAQANHSNQTKKGNFRVLLCFCFHFHYISNNFFV